VNKNEEVIHQRQNKRLQEATWEDYSNFTIQFPDFNLEYKDALKEMRTVDNGNRTEKKGEWP